MNQNPAYPDLPDLEREPTERLQSLNVGRLNTVIR